MKLEHFRSDWNGLRSEKPYNYTPTEETILEAKRIGKVIVGNCRVFAKDNLVEVSAFVGNGISGNVYRDFYRINQ